MAKSKDEGDSAWRTMCSSAAGNTLHSVRQALRLAAVRCPRQESPRQLGPMPSLPQRRLAIAEGRLASQHYSKSLTKVDSGRVWGTIRVELSLKMVTRAAEQHQHMWRYIAAEVDKVPQLAKTAPPALDVYLH